MDAQQEAFSDPSLVTELSTVYNKIKNLHHPAIDYALLASELNTLVTKLKTHTSTPDAMSDYQERCDRMHEEIVSIFTGKVGPEYPPDVLIQKHKEAQKRYENFVPPGFKDLSSKQKTREKETKEPTGMLLPDPYGDAIVWFQLLDFAREQDQASRKPIIFVTDDAKVDWWWIEKGKTLGPRPELIAEMNSTGKSDFYMYNSQSFLTYAAKQVSTPPNQKDLESAVNEAGRLITSNRASKNSRLFSTQYFPFVDSSGSKNYYSRRVNNHKLTFSPSAAATLQKVAASVQQDIVFTAFSIADQPVIAGETTGESEAPGCLAKLAYKLSSNRATIENIQLLIDDEVASIPENDLLDDV